MMSNPNRVKQASEATQTTGRRAAPLNPTVSTHADTPLRWTCRDFEHHQRRRIAIGEQLRAVLQDRDTRWPLEYPVEGEPDNILHDIASGRTTGPARALGEAYHRAWADERASILAMATQLAAHPVWPWLSHIKGAGPSVCGRLLSRLDITKAARPSSFWAFCGLHTVPGARYECAACGATLTYLAEQRPVRHCRPGTDTPCGTVPRLVERGEHFRIAPRPLRGTAREYDSDARVACYLLGLSFTRQGKSYKEIYRRQRGRLATRPGWPPQRQHLAALRITEKHFLVHLWFVWRAALGLPAALGEAMLAGEPVGDPWAMMDK
jgi:hypothetical protein